MGVGTIFTAHFNGRLAFSVCLVALSSANFGFDNQGFSAAQAMQPFAKQFGVYNSKKGQYELQAYWLSLYSSVIWVGFGVGLVAGSSISNKFGRRMGILALCIWSILSSTVIVSSFSKWQVLAGRILFNLYLGAEVAVLSVYQAEAVPTQVRGLVVSTYQFSLSIGGLIMNLICLGTAKIPNNNSWRIPFGLFYIVPFTVLAGLYWVPETPRWLLVNDRREDALRNLRLLREGKRSEEEIHEELKSIEIALREEPEQGRFIEIWQKNNIRRTLIATGINFFQEFSGQQIVFKFGALIVASIGGIDPFVITVTFAVVNIVTVAFAMLLNDKFGRRPFLLASIGIMCVVQMGLGAVGHYDYTTNHALASTAIFFLVMLSLGFSLGYGPLTNVIMTEVVSLRLRDMSVRTAGMARVVANFVVGFTLPYEIDSIGLQLGFIYGGLCFVAFFFTYFCVPECKGKSLEVIEHMFQQGVPARKFRTYKGDAPNLTEEILIEDEMIVKDEEAVDGEMITEAIDVKV